MVFERLESILFIIGPRDTCSKPIMDGLVLGRDLKCFVPFSLLIYLDFQVDDGAR